MMDDSKTSLLWLPPDLLKAHLRAQVGLTAREIDVAAGLIGVRDSKTIGRLLHISHHTIRNHTQNIYSKLNCNTQQTLIAYLEQQGIHESLRQHYLHLQLQPLYQQLLHGIAQTHGGTPPTLLSIRPEIEQSDIPVAYITLTEEHLKTAGFEVIDTDHNDVSRQLAQRTFSHAVAWDHTAASQPDDHNAIWVNSTIDDHPSHLCVSLKNHRDFYGFILSLLQVLVPDHNTTTFQQEHQRVMGQPTINAWSILPAETRAPTSTPSRLIMLGFLCLLAAGGYLGWQQITHQDNSITWNLPPLMSYYTDRPQLTQKIWQQLQQDPGKGTLSLVGLRGMGGTGKTTLALEAMHYPKHTYHFRGWFKADTPELLRSDYLDLGEKMDLLTQRMSENQKIMAVKEWLQEQPSTLLVYDNAPDMDIIRAYLPNRGHVLITSRNSQMPYPVDIEGMQIEEAVTLLDKLIPNTLKQQERYPSYLKILTKELGYIPLALAQAGAYMTEYQLSIPNYLKRYRNLQIQLLIQNTLPPEDPHEPVYITWDMNIQAIQKHPQSEQAMQLLDVIAHLYPEHIPKALLAQHLFGKTDDQAISRLDNVVRLLKTYSLLKSSGDHISIHRLVHGYLQHRHPDNRMPTILKTILHAMMNIHQMDRWNFKLFKSMIPHAEYLKSHGAPWLTQQQQLQLDIILVRMYHLSGRYEQAKQLGERILPIAIQLHGGSQRQIGDIYYNLGWIYRDLGDFIKAKTWFEKALPIYEQQHGLHHIQTTWIYRGLGWIHSDLGQHHQAKSWFEKASSIVEQHQTQYIWIPQLYQELGWVHQELGQALDAKAWFEKALSMAQKHGRGQHVSTARIYQGLGRAYQELGQTLAAKAWLEKALSILQAYYGPEHARTARGYQDLGWICNDLGQPLVAKAWFEKALNIDQKYYGEQHIWTARVYRDLGWTYRELGQTLVAKTWLEKALSIVQKHCGTQHVWTARIHRRLGWIYRDLGQPHQAKKRFMQALAIYEQHHGQNHIWTARTYRGLGWIEMDLDEPEQAKPWFEKTLHVYKHHYNRENSRMAQIYDGLGWVEFKLGSTEQAQMWFKQAIAIRDHHHAHHVWAASSHHGLAWVDFKLGQLESSKIHLQKARQIIRAYQKQGYQFNQELEQSLTELQQRFKGGAKMG